MNIADIANKLQEQMGEDKYYANINVLADIFDLLETNEISKSSDDAITSFIIKTLEGSAGRERRIRDVGINTQNPVSFRDGAMQGKLTTYEDMNVVSHTNESETKLNSRISITSTLEKLSEMEAAIKANKNLTTSKLTMTAGKKLEAYKWLKQTTARLKGKACEEIIKEKIEEVRAVNKINRYQNSKTWRIIAAGVKLKDFTLTYREIFVKYDLEKIFGEGYHDKAKKILLKVKKKLIAEAAAA